MLIDCEGCGARGRACGNCVVSVLLGVPGSGAEAGDDVDAAVRVLSAAGMLPRVPDLAVAPPLPPAALARGA